MYQFNLDLLPQIDEVAQDAQFNTVLDLIRFGTSLLGSADIFIGQGLADPFEESKFLVLNSLNLPLDDFFLSSKITQSEKQQILELFKLRIGERIPAAYLCEKARFANLDFYINQNVIIPRSPIAELIKNNFGFDENFHPNNILDMCCGSACLAIALAYKYPNANVDAVDISPKALEVAEINIDLHQRFGQVNAIQSDLFTNLENQKYDLIICNPPYVDAQDMADLPYEFHFEPTLALSSGDDGLDLTLQIIQKASDYLTDNGILICEVGNSSIALTEKFPNFKFKWQKLQKGGAGIFMLDKNDLYDLKKIYK